MSGTNITPAYADGGGLADTERIEIETWARRHGCANCWTGTTGTAGKYILRLLEVIDEQERRLQNVSREQVTSDR